MNAAMAVQVDESVAHFAEDVGNLLLVQALELVPLLHRLQEISHGSASAQLHGDPDLIVVPGRTLAVGRIQLRHFLLIIFATIFISSNWRARCLIDHYQSLIILHDDLNNLGI